MAGSDAMDQDAQLKQQQQQEEEEEAEEEEGPSFKIDDVVVTLLELVHHHAAWDTDAGGLRMLGERGVQISVGSIGMDFRVGGLRRLVLDRMATCGLLSGKEVPIRCRPSDVCLFEASLEGI